MRFISKVRKMGIERKIIEVPKSIREEVEEGEYSVTLNKLK